MERRGLLLSHPQIPALFAGLGRSLGKRLLWGRSAMIGPDGKPLNARWGEAQQCGGEAQRLEWGRRDGRTASLAEGVGEAMEA